MATGTAATCDFYAQRVLEFQPYPAGNFSWHHLWFIIYLYVYVLLLLPLMLWWRKARPTMRPGAWILALALPLGINEALLKPHFPGDSQPRQRLVHLHSLPVAHVLRFRDRLDAPASGTGWRSSGDAL